MSVTIAPDHILVIDGSTRRRFHHVWLRDNCGCPACRVDQSAERRQFTAHIPDDITAVAATIDDHALSVTWSDGHTSEFSRTWLAAFDYSNRRPARTGIIRDGVELWDHTLRIPRFDHALVLGDPHVQQQYLRAVISKGIAVVTGVPCEPLEVERFAESIGHVREVAFERVHNVHHDPDGYNVAHTPLELKPHSDMPSYHWPPSIQLLHFLANRAVGGESTAVDGWWALQRLWEEDSAAFEVLTRVPVSFQLFSRTEDTFATAPIISTDPTGIVTGFRFSNQLALPIDTDFNTMPEFYRAYRMLGRIIDSEEAKVVYRAADGDLVTVHGHRVLHGRLPFSPGTGERHLQDVYMEFDDFVARSRVLAGTHLPLSPRPAGVRDGVPA